MKNIVTYNLNGPSWKLIFESYNDWKLQLCPCVDILIENSSIPRE